MKLTLPIIAFSVTDRMGAYHLSINRPLYPTSDLHVYRSWNIRYAARLLFSLFGSLHVYFGFIYIAHWNTPDKAAWFWHLRAAIRHFRNVRKGVATPAPPRPNGAAGVVGKSVVHCPYP